MPEAVNSSSGYYLTQNSTNQPKGLGDPDAFLKILVEQLKNQDPMNPQDSSTFITQLSQMATMEQMCNVSRSMEQLAEKHEMARYFDLIGQKVTVTDGEELITGTVGGVVFDNQQPYFYLGDAPDGNRYTLEQVTMISARTSGDLLPYLALIGHLVKVRNDNGEIEGTVDKVLLQNGNAAVMVDGEVFGVERIIEIGDVPDAAAN
ncbi:hypothetical protein IT084_03075 [Desulfallas sp. Bu1-1]|uniref:flagellar hook capping FlgD N-terminal domain-containing protein n=1 Tax=Desulfallas sp. Bu1-1 TaxID=2787620 RepID=UPI0018A00B03|nr:flagellar hook capping FlgD N-terminal domain-containing protein [Desulfallas sp. Bu1-1]MBF7081958.1 hypothetical protein [Desulfallas sp. Bu1-1]